jgi:topoisomerase IA-like protein
VRIGRYGPYLEFEEDGQTVRANLPDTIAPADLTDAMARDLLRQRADGPPTLGTDPATGLPVYLMSGQYGPYVQLGEAGEDEKPKRASLAKGMTPETVTLEQALGLLALPRTLGAHPETGNAVKASVGRFGPFVVHAKGGADGKDDFRSVPAGGDVLAITLDEAVALLAQPKRGRGAAGGTAVQPLRELGAFPGSTQAVLVFEGRYGPYVQLGATPADRKGAKPGAGDAAQGRGAGAGDAGAGGGAPGGARGDGGGAGQGAGRGGGAQGRREGRGEEGRAAEGRLTAGVVLPAALRGERCVLRPWRLADRPALLRHANDAGVAANLRLLPHPYGDAAADAWLAHAAVDPVPEGLWAVEAGRRGRGLHRARARRGRRGAQLRGGLLAGPPGVGARGRDRRAPHRDRPPRGASPARRGCTRACSGGTTPPCACSRRRATGARRCWCARASRTASSSTAWCTRSRGTRGGRIRAFAPPAAP